MRPPNRFLICSRWRCVVLQSRSNLQKIGKISNFGAQNWKGGSSPLPLPKKIPEKIVLRVNSFLQFSQKLRDFFKNTFGMFFKFLNFLKIFIKFSNVLNYNFINEVFSIIAYNFPKNLSKIFLKFFKIILTKVFRIFSKISSFILKRLNNFSRTSFQVFLNFL